MAICQNSFYSKLTILRFNSEIKIEPNRFINYYNLLLMLFVIYSLPEGLSRNNHTNKIAISIQYSILNNNYVTPN